jgi:ABC-2 type transport system permease protein
MPPTLVIAKRELTSLFYSPIAYVVLGLFSFGTALIFLLGGFAPGELASMRTTFRAVIWLMIFLVPAISMRLLSEEFRSGTIESLMTAPIRDEHIVVGKWLGAMGFLLVLMVPLLVLTTLLNLFANPDPGPIFTGFVGLILVGGFYLAVGTFGSACNQNQIIAFVLTVFILGVFSFLTFFLPQAEFVNEFWREVMFYLNVYRQFEDFSQGLIDSSNFIFFITGILLFLFLAIKLLESQRWR